MTTPFTRTDIILENERVLMRPLIATDIQLLLPFSLHEPEIWKYSLLPVAGAENLERYIQTAIRERENGVSYPFIVYDKLKQAYAGCTRYYDLQLDYKTLQLGYTWYGTAFQGTGLNKNCKYLLLEYAFESLEMERVEFRADYNNKRSIAAMERIGCTVEGILRSHMPAPQGGRRDSIILSILKSEWLATVKSKLKGGCQ
jgi:RimJ/RimL family protein N-acetyltransferase